MSDIFFILLWLVRENVSLIAQYNFENFHVCQIIYFKFFKTTFNTAYLHGMVVS